MSSIKALCLDPYTESYFKLFLTILNFNMWSFLARLEGGCSVPVDAVSKITNESICLEGIVLDLFGKQRIYDKFEMKFNNSLVTDCPMNFRKKILNSLI